MTASVARDVTLALGGAAPLLGGLEHSIRRLREASGPGGYRRADVESVCDAAEKLERLRQGVACAISYLRATGGGVIASTAIELLEGARDGGGWL